MDFKRLNKGRQIESQVQLDVVEAYTKGNMNRREFLRRGSVVGLSVPFLGAVIAACGGDATSDTTVGSTDGTTAGSTDGTTAPGAAGGIVPGGVLRIAAQRPGSPLDPVAMDNIGSYTPVLMSMEYLCGPGEGFALAPMLAEEWAPNDDGSVWTFTLRQGVKWHSGNDFTAADVVATLDRLAPTNLGAYIV
ncbi:MAG: ABC transporter substrate-binding protein, partial [Acidimicrobiia bacterium]